MKTKNRLVNGLVLLTSAAILTGCATTGRKYDTPPPGYWYAANPTMWPVSYASTLGADPIFVEGAFNAAEAAEQMKEGSATIHGYTYFNERRKKVMFEALIDVPPKDLVASNISVCIFPSNELTLNWAMKRDDIFERSRDQMLGRYYGVFMKDEKAYEHHKCTTSNRYGEYKFENVKPGQYVAIAVGMVYFTESGSQRTGYVTNGYYSADVYQNVTQTVTREHTGAWVVTVQNLNDNVFANLKIESVIPYMY
jgi:hypothetical protein